MLAMKLVFITFLAGAWGCKFDGVRYNVACPGENTVLRCPKGYTIQVRAMSHGMSNPNVCANSERHAITPRMNCMDHRMLGWAKFTCNNKENCRLSKPHPRMFWCKNADKFFVQTTYMCKCRTEDVRTAVACEGYEAKIKCEEGCINIVKADFGRFDAVTCTSKPSIMTFCKSYAAEGIVRQTCYNKQECTIKAEAATLGNGHHCDKNPKYLTVDYTCKGKCKK